MPTTRTEQVSGFAHCRDPFCAGNKQRPATVTITSTDWTFFDMGGAGSVPGIEKTATAVTFADNNDEPCPVCAKPCEPTDMARPQYPVTRRDWEQDGLLKLIQTGLVKPGGDTPSEVDALKRALAELQETIADMKANPPRRGPGRPPNPKE